MRILFVTSSLPWPLERDGGGQRSGLLLAALGRHGPVDVLFVHHKPWDAKIEGVFKCMGQATTVIGDLMPAPREGGQSAGRLAKLTGRAGFAVRTLTRQAAHYRADQSIVDWMRTRGIAERYDVLVGRYLWPGVCARAGVGPDRPVLLDFDDMDWMFQRARQSAQAAALSWAAKAWGHARMWHLERICRRVTRNFDHVWVTSAEDLRAAGTATWSVLPNIPFDADGDVHGPLPPSRADSRTLLYVGRLSYSPNVYGLERFLETVWPSVRARQPAAELRIVGTRLTEARKAKWSAHPGVRVVGFVEDLTREYADCAFTIAPVYWGGGTKIKVLDSLSRGRTCVATPHALYGYGCVVNHGDSVWCAPTDEEFADGCVALLADAPRRAALEAKGAQVVARHFNKDVFNQAVAAALAQVESNMKPGTKP